MAERWGRWLLWLKISCAQIFWFCNSNVTTFPKSRKCKNFNFSFYTVRAEMLYLQKYLTNLQKLFFCLKEVSKVTIVVENFLCTRYFGFGIATLQLFQISRKCKNFNFSLLHCPEQKCYIFKSILTNFEKNFSWMKDEEDSYCGWKCLVHRYFGFAIATLQISKIQKM